MPHNEATLPPKVIDRMPHPIGNTKNTALSNDNGNVSVASIALSNGDSVLPSQSSWVSAAFAERDDMTVEVDEAVGGRIWRLSIDMPTTYLSLHIEGSEELGKLIEFLNMIDERHHAGPPEEFRMSRSSVFWVPDDETTDRLFLWLNRGGKHSMRAEMNRKQIGCVRSALAEAAQPG